MFQEISSSKRKKVFPPLHNYKEVKGYTRYKTWTLQLVRCLTLNVHPEIITFVWKYYYNTYVLLHRKLKKKCDTSKFRNIIFYKTTEIISNQYSLRFVWVYSWLNIMQEARPGESIHLRESFQIKWQIFFVFTSLMDGRWACKRSREEGIP